MAAHADRNGAGLTDAPFVEEVPGVWGGYPVIRNTRIGVSALVELQRQGATVEELAELYPHVGVDAIRGALDYYRRHPARVDADLERQERAWTEYVERTTGAPRRP
jgi:uncharacterized protein (DUF433 family)